MSHVEERIARGEIGGRTVQINTSGEVECVVYETAPLAEGQVRVRTHVTAISPGTETTYIGKDASNVYLHRRWNTDLRIFQDGTSALDYPIVTLGYRAAGTVVESDDARVPIGTRIWGNWLHTEFVSMPADQAVRQTLPDSVSWEDAVDIGQMAPIAINAALFGGGEQQDAPAVVIGAGPIGLLTAQAIRSLGASSVRVIDRSPFRLSVAESMGFIPVETVDTDVAAVLKTELGAEGIPVVWECSGAVPALNDAIRLVRRQGAVIAAGFYQGGTDAVRLGEEFHHNGVRIISAQIGNPHSSTDRPGLQITARDWITDGGMAPRLIPSTPFPVEEVAEAYRATRRTDETVQSSLSFG